MSSPHNPLLDWQGPVPPWADIQPAHLEPAVDAILQRSRDAIAALLQQDSFTWDNFGAPLEELEQQLHEAFSPGAHLHSVNNTEEWRAAYEACLPKLTAYSTEMGQNPQLFAAWKALSEQPNLSPEQRQIVDHSLRDFRLSGVDLEPASKARFAEIQQQLAELSNRFETQLLDATDGWHLHLRDSSRLAGLPESALAQGRAKAQARDEEGYIYGLDYPSFNAIITYADDRALREEIYQAFVTRASDQSPQNGGPDNLPLMQQILALRHEEAQLLGYANFAQVSLVPKMAESPDAVEQFLLDLAHKAKPAAQAQLAALNAFAAEHGADTPLAAWDMAYWAEKHKESTLGLSDEKLRPYFALPQVLQGLFSVAQKLFGIQVRPVAIPLWHAEAQAFAVDDEHGQQIAWFYTDLYAREKKRGGAWMGDCASLYTGKQSARLPIATLTCNFRAPVGDQPALLTHDEVLTLFHEFGHGLHHMLTEIDLPSVGGINGVPWDAVELPSQFLENWCWEREALDIFARHIESDQPLPEPMLEQLQQSRSYNAGLATLRQIEFALFDLRLHRDYCSDQAGDIGAVLEQVRSEVAVVRPPAYNRFANSFSHIFAGGYAAGYYSYKWAEVLSADAFGAFKEEGLFNPSTGARFRDAILRRGGSEDAAVLYQRFRGRPPQIEALLEQDGLAAAA
nr:M3 family metallopeptidase [Oceanococcus sp. HetDA_MAG_MS8]